MLLVNLVIEKRNVITVLLTPLPLTQVHSAKTFLIRNHPQVKPHRPINLLLDFDPLLPSNLRTLTAPCVSCAASP
jgi:hypothetical protein